MLNLTKKARVPQRHDLNTLVLPSLGASEEQKEKMRFKIIQNEIRKQSLAS
jgi:hypothetical protein